jgi:hypothetical protein
MRSCRNAATKSLFCLDSHVFVEMPTRPVRSTEFIKEVISKLTDDISKGRNSHE